MGFEVRGLHTCALVLVVGAFGFFFFQAEDGIRDYKVTGVQTCALPICTSSPRLPAYCHVSPPWLAGTQVKFLFVYPLPLGFQTSATYQNIAGIPILASNPTPNSQIAPNLGRNVGSCRGAATCNANVNIDLIPYQSLYEDRLQQLDVRIARIFHFGKARVRGNFDVYNALNGASILSQNAGYGAKWLTPYEIMGGRLYKFSGQIDF